MTAVHPTARPRPEGTVAPVSFARELPAWPLGVAFTGFVVWWLVGLSWAAWLVAAVAMVPPMLMVGRIRVPRGFTLWLVFLFAILCSAAELNGATGIFSWAYNFAAYLAATVFMVYVYNLRDAARKLARYVANLWALTTVCGVLGVLFPFTKITAPVGHLLPDSVRSIDLIAQTVTLRFASNNYLGAPRPSAPFAYSNRWGAVLLFTLPAVVWLALKFRERWQNTALLVLLVVSIVPIVYSQNRGLWAGLLLGVLFLLARAARQLNGRAIVGVVVMALVVGALLVTTSLSAIAQVKLESDYSATSRLAVYSATLTALQESPIFGHGSSGSAYGATVGSVPIGTQGQLWVLLYAGGLLATATFYVWLFATIWITRKDRSTIATVFRLPLLLAVPISVVYGFVPDSMLVLACCAGVLGALERDRRAAPPGTGPAGGSAGEAVAAAPAAPARPVGSRRASTLRAASG